MGRAASSTPSPRACSTRGAPASRRLDGARVTRPLRVAPPARPGDEEEHSDDDAEASAARAEKLVVSHARSLVSQTSALTLRDVVNENRALRQKVHLLERARLPWRHGRAEGDGAPREAAPAEPAGAAELRARAAARVRRGAAAAARRGTRPGRRCARHRRAFPEAHAPPPEPGHGSWTSADGDAKRTRAARQGGTRYTMGPPRWGRSSLLRRCLLAGGS